MSKKKCKHGCNRPAAIDRNECYTCRSRLIRDRKPIDICFYHLKKSAKKRHLEFTITLVWFKNWIINTGYMEHKGRLSDSLTIDREDNLRGYTMDNISVKTKHDNCVKYHTIDLHRELGPQYEGVTPF